MDVPSTAAACVRELSRGSRRKTDVIHQLTELRPVVAACLGRARRRSIVRAEIG
jgi:hypothetical protein